MPQSRKRTSVALLSVVCFAQSACSSDDGGGKRGASSDAGDAAMASDPESLASDAFVWGFPLIVTQRTMQTVAALIQTNSLFNQQALTTPGYRFIVAPNQDTLYSVAVLDVRNEPMVLTCPDTPDRYWTYQFLDAWTNSFHYIGTRATSGKGGSFAITAPGWSGTLPSGVTQIESPTPELFLLGRFLVRGDADFQNVSDIQRTLVPLSTLTGDPPAPASPGVGTAPGTPQEVGDTGAAFFDELGDALSVNGPASAEDTAELARFASLGIGPGLHPATDGNAEIRAALEAGATDGLARVEQGVTEAAEEKNGWRTFLDIGTYTDDFLVRAAVAKFAWGANVPAEAVYPLSRADGAGAPYDGTKQYKMHFAASELPPVDATSGFWSVTLYSAKDMFFVENAIHRYAIGDRTPGLSYGADGSLDLYIQNTAPAGHEANWLPAPPSPFVLILRLYLPPTAVQEGKYVVPPVVAR